MTVLGGFQSSFLEVKYGARKFLNLNFFKGDDHDLYTQLKQLQRQEEFLDIQVL